MSRAVWFAAGAGVGVYAITKARRVVDAFTPDGLADRLAGLSLGAHLLASEVRAGMAEAETGVRARLQVGSHGSPPAALPPVHGDTPTSTNHSSTHGEGTH